jgi:hypothetical protein
MRLKGFMMDATETGKKYAVAAYMNVITYFVILVPLTVLMSLRDFDAMAGAIVGLLGLLAAICGGAFVIGFLAGAAAAGTAASGQAPASQAGKVRVFGAEQGNLAASPPPTVAPTGDGQATIQRSGLKGNYDGAIGAAVALFLWIFIQADFVLSDMPATAVRQINAALRGFGLI